MESIESSTPHSYSTAKYTMDLSCTILAQRTSVLYRQRAYLYKVITTLVFGQLDDPI